jgi:hypothetical protein
VNKTFIKGFLLAVVVCFSTLLSIQARADDQDLAYSISFTDDELDNLLAPIALYPDPLLAQILPASTYPEEVGDAEAWINRGGDVSRIDEQDWAESVRSIAHYPDVLHLMAGNMDWTANLGDAFLNQPEDVANSIQRLRWRARAVGNLFSNAEQTVIIDGDYIQIVPAQPQYMYVPQYDTAAVYFQAPAGISPLVTFGFGLAIGGWLTMDFDWGHHHVIYHGWDRPGWVNHARPYVHVRNVYVNRSRPLINQRWTHDRSHGDPGRYLASRPSGPNADIYKRVGEARGSTTVQPGPAGGISRLGGNASAYSNRGRESRGTVNQPSLPTTPSMSIRRPVPTPGVSQPPSTPSPGFGERRKTPIPDVSQRPPAIAPSVSSGPSQPGPARVTQQPARTPSVTFGGYRGAGEARTQSLRGQESRQSSGGMMRPSTPPASRGGGGVPAGRGASGDKQRR